MVQSAKEIIPARDLLMRPKLFIASSSEHLDLAYAAQEELERDAICRVWTQGVFSISEVTILSLVAEIKRSDFGLFVFTPSDVTEIRDSKVRTVRDNVLFELGLFIGGIGVERCFILAPRDIEALHLPSDLLGLTTATYDPQAGGDDLQSALGPPCNKIRRAMLKLGVVSPTALEETKELQQVDGNLCSDPDDCLALIQAWMGARSTTQNLAAIRYDEVDRELKIAPGSARLYIQKAAKRWGYTADVKGKDIILFIKDSIY